MNNQPFSDLNRSTVGVVRQLQRYIYGPQLRLVVEMQMGGGEMRVIGITTVEAPGVPEIEPIDNLEKQGYTSDS